MKLEQWNTHGPVRMLPKRPLLDPATGKLVRGWRLKGSYGFEVTCSCGRMLLKVKGACLQEWIKMARARNHTHLACECGQWCEVEPNEDSLRVELRDRDNGCPGAGRRCGRPLHGGELCKWCEKRARRSTRVRSGP